MTRPAASCPAARGSVAREAEFAVKIVLDQPGLSGGCQLDQAQALVHPHRHTGRIWQAGVR